MQLDENGWANVQHLIQKMNENGTSIDIQTLNIIVDTNDKKRFSFNNDKKMIRANQGHSIEVELNLKTAVPPDVLFHGTAERFLQNILREGLDKTAAAACSFKLAIRYCQSCWYKTRQTSNFKY